MSVIQRGVTSIGIIGAFATIVAALAAIFPDVFVVRGRPPFGLVLSVASALALPTAILCGLIYLVILNRRFSKLQRAHLALAQDHAALSRRYDEYVEQEKARGLQATDRGPGSTRTPEPLGWARTGDPFGRDRR